MFIKNKRILYIIIITIFIVIIDQILKTSIADNLYNGSIVVLPRFLNMTYVENTGGAFGIGDNSTIMFVMISIIIITIIIKFILEKKNELNSAILISLTLILAGGISNLIDRIFRGFVIDYIDINPIIKFPIFNIADICVVVACAILFISIIIEIKKES